MKKLISILSLITVIIVLGYTLPVGSSFTPVQTSPLQIAYEFTSSASTHTICIITVGDHDSSCLKTEDGVTNTNPRWSPDGQWLLYEQSSPGISASYLHSIESGLSEKVDLALWSSLIVDWSPDGMLFTVIGMTGPDANRELYSVKTDGSELQALTRTAPPLSHPVWSPDGRQIAYISGIPEGTLTVISSTGENQRTLTTDLDVDPEVPPMWSPDSTRIAFVIRNKMVGTDQLRDIYLINADGTNLQQLTDNYAINLDPQWSPDGTQLVFYGYETGAFDPNNTKSLGTEVFRINADGSDFTNLTQSAGLDYEPMWSPDGNLIAFASTRQWESEAFRGGIFIITPDGKDVAMITDLPPFDGQSFQEAHKPVWRPIPTKLE
ncbi:MAG TPA: hypothetical protein VHL11_15775 [Phototrophicaceae bacterium]|jgi:TolB protein|nr:hypothetical protein [Phototrophicaceae bacterium]